MFVLCVEIRRMRR